MRTRSSSVALLLTGLIVACEPTPPGPPDAAMAPVIDGSVPDSFTDPSCRRHDQCKLSYACGFALGSPVCLEERNVVYADAGRKDCATLADPLGGTLNRPLCSLKDAQVRQRERKTPVLVIRVFPGRYDAGDGTVWYQQDGAFTLSGPDPGTGRAELDGRSAIVLGGSRDVTELRLFGSFLISGQKDAISCEQATPTQPAELLLRGEPGPDGLPGPMAIVGAQGTGLRSSGCGVQVYSVLFDGNRSGALRAQDGKFLVRDSLFRSNRSKGQSVAVLSSALGLRDVEAGSFAGNVFVDNVQEPLVAGPDPAPGPGAVNCRSIKVPLERTLLCQNTVGAKGLQYGGDCTPISVVTDPPDCARYRAR